MSELEDKGLTSIVGPVPCWSRTPVSPPTRQTAPRTGPHHRDQPQPARPASQEEHAHDPGLARCRRHRRRHGRPRARRRLPRRHPAYDLDLPEVRLVAVADAHEPFAIDAAARFGYERAETRGRPSSTPTTSTSSASSIANELHRESSRACSPPASTCCARSRSPRPSRTPRPWSPPPRPPTRSRGVGFTFRRTPAIAAIRGSVETGAIGAGGTSTGTTGATTRVDTDGPMSWRYKGGPGTGRPGRHRQPHDRPRGVRLRADRVGQRRDVPDLHHRARPCRSAPPSATPAAGGQRRPRAGRERGHRHLHRDLRLGGVGTFSASRVAFGLANWLGFELFAANGGGDLRPQPRRRVRLRRPRRRRRDQRLPAGARRPPAPVPHRRPGDGLPLRRLRPERPVRLAGARLPRPGRRASASCRRCRRFAARPAQHAHARRRSPSPR